MTNHEVSTVVQAHTLDSLPTPETALVPVPQHLPSIAEVRQHLAWLAEMRQLLVEYVEQHMDPQRHMYTFANNTYTRLETRAEVQTMLAKGQKPALNQDGIHTLMALYGCDVEDQRVEESRGDGAYTVRVTLWLRYFGSRRVVGMGSCSTRESKYAYRWVYDKQVPRGVDKAALKSRVFEPEGKRPYTRYRLDNEDLADVEATVLQMAFKRAKSSAVKSLPGVSEMFAQVGDPDEAPPESDGERQALLLTLRAWLRGLSAATQVKALRAVFGEPLRANDVPQLPEDRLAVACQVVAIATRAGIAWTSPTLLTDLKAVLQASATQAQRDLYGTEPVPDPAEQAPPVPQEPRTPPDQGGEGDDPPALILEPSGGLRHPPPPAPSPIWATLEDWYTAAGRAEHFAAFQAWCLRRYAVRDRTQIAEADLEDLARRAYATLEPLMVQREAAAAPVADPWRVDLAALVGQLADANLAREAQSVLEDPDASAAQGRDLLGRVRWSVEGQGDGPDEQGAVDEGDPSP